MTSIGTAVRTEISSYDLSAPMADERLAQIPAGSNLLVSGPSMVGKERVTLDALSSHRQREHPLVIVTSDQSAERLLDQFESLDVSVDRENVYVVDCSGTTGRGGLAESTTVKYVSSPDDLTGIGIGIAKCTSDIGEDARDGLGIGVLSLSTLLQYASKERVFNFTHVMTGRVAAAGYLGVWTLDSSSHDEQTISTMQGQFDYVAEIREDESGSREIRVLGGEEDWRTWEPLRA